MNDTTCNIEANTPMLQSLLHAPFSQQQQPSDFALTSDDWVCSDEAVVVEIAVEWTLTS